LFDIYIYIYIYIYIVIFSLYLFCYCFFILFKLLFKPKILGLFLAKHFYYIKNKILEPRQSMNTMSDELYTEFLCNLWHKSNRTENKARRDKIRHKNNGRHGGSRFDNCQPHKWTGFQTSVGFAYLSFGP